MQESATLPDSVQECLLEHRKQAYVMRSSQENKDEIGKLMQEIDTTFSELDSAWTKVRGVCRVSRTQNGEGEVQLSV